MPNRFGLCGLTAKKMETLKPFRCINSIRGNMHIEAFYNFCMSLPGTTEGFPFGEEVLVFKVMGKMFALCDVDKFESINLKCDPVRALELRAAYEEIQPGYHMNKKHWNTVSMQGDLDDEIIKELIRHSYDLVVAKFPKKDREELNS